MKMKLKAIVHFFLLLPVMLLTGQSLKVEPYEFISRSKDTVQAELGSFKVLEDRNNESLDSIQLSFVRFKSTNPNPGSPIVYLSGGPGGSGIGTAKGKRFSLFMNLREVADVIAFDQRGTGMSTRLLECPYTASFELSKAIDKQEYVDKSTENITKCLAFWQEKNVNLGAYNTTENAKDIEALRNVLKVEKISLWGISYGSHLAFEYIRLFEDNIDKVVLASLEGPNETIKLPENTANFIFQIAEKATTNYGADITYPNLKKKMLAVHGRLEKSPVISTYVNRQGRIDTVGISNFELQSAIATFYLKNPEDSKIVPRLYDQMYHGNFTEIAPNVMILKKYIYSRIRPMPFSMDMQSGISQDRKRIMKRQIDDAILGSTINFLQFEWMQTTNFRQLPKQFRKMKPNKVDALLLSGTMDGRTYVSSAIELAKKFKNGRHIIIENAGHDLYMQSPLVSETVLAFFKENEIGTNRIKLKPILFE